MLSSIFLTLPLSAWTLPPAFPGAEGAGMFVTGGRGGDVYYVTSLEDDGSPGTFRWAIKQKGPRTILFKVSGIITLTKTLDINNGDLTIAGQSAPGDGICIRNYGVHIKADNVIIRYLRFRLGDETLQQDDALGAIRRKGIIVDHCSMSWSVDECASFYDNTNFTLQWCILAESLRKSKHEKGSHGYGGIWGGKNATFHHNLLFGHDSRNPRFCGSRYSNKPDEERVDFRNNVIYNWGSNATYAGEGGSYNIVNNYYKPGPASKHTNRFLDAWADNGRNKQPAGIYGIFYVKGNILEGNKDVTRENKLGVIPNEELFRTFAPNVKKNDLLSKTEFSMPYVKTTSARKAYDDVLKLAGASKVRDVLDLRYVDETRRGMFTFLGSSGSLNGQIDSQEDVGGWPEYQSIDALTDSDEDGIPDGWIEKYFPGKKSTDTNSQGYTYLEIYLNSLVDQELILPL